MKVFDRKITLASQSPRRSRLLREAGFDFEVKTREIDESYPNHLPPAAVAEYIANNKAEGCRDLRSPDHVLLTADTIVVFDNRIYGKPKNEADAIRILLELAGQTHHVITGVCLLDEKKKVIFHDVSEVQFDPLTEEEAHYYVRTCRPLDKAGAYGAQEWMGHCKVSQIKGSYANIMGLPVHRVYRRMHEFIAAD